MKLIKNKPQFAWIMYDWANSAFATTVMAGFFPVFFKNYWSSSTDVNVSTAYLGLANSIASLIVAMLAPVLGAIADQGNSRKKFLIFFAYMSILMTGCLFLVEMGDWPVALFLYIMGTIGFSGANIFYDSLLPDVANEKNIDYISAKGFSLGYLGGGLLFLVNVLWYTMPSSFGFATEFTSPVINFDQSNQGVQLEVESTEYDFSEKENFPAILTSYYKSEIEELSLYRENNTNFAEISLSLDKVINWENLNPSISFGEYKKAEFVAVNKESGKLLVKNLTRKISENDPVKLRFDNEIIISKCEKGVCYNVKGLNNYWNDPVLKTDLLKPAQEFLPIRLSFLSVALWWGLFTIPLILWIKEKKHTKKRGIFYYSKKGFKQLGKTFSEIKHLKYVFLFLLAYWMYIDGVNTVIRMAVDYGMSIGLPSSSLITALLITQFVGFPSALVFGKLGEKWSVKNSLYIGIFVYLATNIWAVFMNSVLEFYVMAIVIGIVQGGIQALSRSMYSRLIPKNQSAEYYGFYNMTGKFAAIFGPALVGSINIIARTAGFNSNAATRIGIGSIAILFIGGSILLYFVDLEKGKEQVDFLSNNRLKK
ncbi:MAG: MFS transporter [Fidelibacterota bacterium]